ncbi:DUF4190 domain-containing protein [Nocardia iowensis]|uniref:DUF4190 domain-containing protein n=1 Tax=Nocardia iowensis TaxID=204891 RepID=A0ABX8RGT6_NOCIO|nr:DUF4190 domain-containing protein [Nocardia iowensis]QXN88551.1 DUF4190 domain-containing protein [Nocardia iowensis]
MTEEFPPGYTAPGQYPPPAGPYRQQSESNGLAIAALVLGILALVSFWTVIGGILLGLAGLVIGIIATSRARKGTAGGSAMAITGLVLSIVALIATAVALAVGFALFGFTGGDDFTDCVSDAGNDRAKIDQCERDWQQTVENKFSVTISPRPTN